MVEPQPSKLMMWVRSPSPAPAKTSEFGRLGGLSTVAAKGTSAHIAQLVEHFLGKEEVTGSNPVMGSKKAAGEVCEWIT